MQKEQIASLVLVIPLQFDVNLSYSFHSYIPETITCLIGWNRFIIAYKQKHSDMTYLPDQFTCWDLWQPYWHLYDIPGKFSVCLKLKCLHSKYILPTCYLYEDKIVLDFNSRFELSENCSIILYLISKVFSHLDQI